MRVNSINPNYNFNFGSKKRKKKKTAAPQSNITPYVNNRAMVRTYNFPEIVRPIIILVRTQRAGTFDMRIFPQTIRKYLFDEQGQNPQYIQKFSSVCTDTVRELEDQYEYDWDDLDCYENADQITLMLEEHEVQAAEHVTGKSRDDEDFTEALLKARRELRLKMYENRTYELDNEQINSLSQRAYHYTEGFFELSKTPKGYDFSNQKLKINLMSMVEALEDRYGEDFLKDLIENCKDKNNKTDIDLMMSVATILQQADIDVPIKRVSDDLKKYYVNNEDQKKEITAGILGLNYGNFILTDIDRDEEFESVFELCFNDKGRFQKEACSALLALDQEAAVWVGENEIAERPFYFYKGFVKMVILEYFDLATDEEGNFTTPDILPEEFFKMKLRELPPTIVK